jgi:hypothetical protein
MVFYPIFRRIVLFGTPLAVATDIIFLHPTLGGNIRTDFFPVADFWLALHVVQLVLFGLMGMTVYLLLDGVSSIAAAISRLAVAMFIVFYNAGDAVAGVATGIIARSAVQLSTEKQAAVADAIARLFSDPVTQLIFVVGACAWSLALLAAAVALYQCGAPRLPLIPLALAGLPFIDLFGFVHSPPFNPIALALFALAVIWLELASRKRAPAAEDSADRSGVP